MIEVSGGGQLNVKHKTVAIEFVSGSSVGPLMVGPPFYNIYSDFKIVQ